MNRLVKAELKTELNFAKRYRSGKAQEIQITVEPSFSAGAGVRKLIAKPPPSILSVVSRPTAWALLNRDNRAGPSSIIIKRILSSPNLPPEAREKVEEYVEEKIAGLYGHTEYRRRWFRDQFSHSRPS